jgi:Tfp pilus assembly protein FimV
MGGESPRSTIRLEPQNSLHSILASNMFSRFHTLDGTVKEKKGKPVGPQKASAVKPDKAKAKKSGETLSSRVGKIEAALKRIETQIEQKDSQLAAAAGQLQESEQRISGRITDLQNQIKQNADAAPDPDNCITLEEGHAVNIEELEKKMEQRYALLATRDREFQDLKEKVWAELEGLKVKNKEKDVLLAAREMEMKNFKRAAEASPT